MKYLKILKSNHQYFKQLSNYFFNLFNVHRMLQAFSFYANSDFQVFGLVPYKVLVWYPRMIAYSFQKVSDDKVNGYFLLFYFPLNF